MILEPLGIDPGEEPRAVPRVPCEPEARAPGVRDRAPRAATDRGCSWRAARTPVTMCARVPGPDATPSPLLGDNRR